MANGVATLLLAGVGLVVTLGCMMTTGLGRCRVLGAAGCGPLAFLAVSTVALDLGWL